MRHQSLRVASVVAMAIASAGTAVPPTQHGDPRADDSARTTQGVAPDQSPTKIRPITGLSASTVARYPLVDDPVAFCIDEQGRFFFAESDRQERGVEDNRSSRFWLLDDLASESVADRLQMYEKWSHKRAGGMSYYSKFDDRVARLADMDGDGVPETRTVFAGPFNEPLDGTGAGVLALDGDIFYTNIPSLWRLRDADGDGVAESREKASTGYGVRVALRGHDMHGLVLGYDGKVYWSIGDRLRLGSGCMIRAPVPCSA